MQRPALFGIAAGAAVVAGGVIALALGTTPSPPEIHPVQLSATSDNIIGWPNAAGASAVDPLADAAPVLQPTNFPYTLMSDAPPSDIDQVIPGFWMTATESYAVYDASDPLLAVPATGPQAGTEEIATTYATWFGLISNKFYEVTDATGSLTSNVGQIADTLYLPLFGEIPILTAALELPADFPATAADVIPFDLPF